MTHSLSPLADQLEQTTARILVTGTPTSYWLVFDTAAERDAAEAYMINSWVTLEDRSVLVNYSVTWQDVAGPALHVAHAPAHGTSGYTKTTRRTGGSR